MSERMEENKVSDYCTEMLYYLPVASEFFSSGLELYAEGMNCKLSWCFEENNKEKKTTLLFNTVAGSQYCLPIFVVDIYNAFEQLVEVKNSSWVKRFSQINPKDIKYFDLKHYVIFFGDDGLYEFLATNVEIITEDVNF
ncbi:hypothetical protein BG261_08545 [Floricoccus tropicus]|uniref:Uncharacterized protein n=1 Tax=Floricoccus tropicus TaxID=1859473 RepID=A0A1E8GJB1_9LACT|nr:hypothetical protein [Floricoccus tropicus]OFI48321.1 hypothetical protein BG261_08545 [Floricoccus tropicus]